MTLNYGRPPDPEGFVIGALLRLNRPVGPERDQETALPCYVVTALHGTSDKFMSLPIVSVHSFATTRAAAKDAARDADSVLISLTAGDLVTLPDGSTAAACVECISPPAFADYRDPLIKRYAARYRPYLRFTATQS